MLHSFIWQASLREQTVHYNSLIKHPLPKSRAYFSFTSPSYSSEKLVIIDRIAVELGNFF